MEGAYYIENYITQEYHDELVKFITVQQWNTSLARRTQHYGSEYNYSSKTLNKVCEIPSIFDKLLDKIEHAFPHRPDQIIINEYEPGQGIAAHIDHVKNFGPIVASISLLSYIEMTFTKNSDAFVQLLAPKSVLLLSGKARYEWKHEITKHKTYKFNGQRLQRTKRISITLRTVNK